MRLPVLPKAMWHTRQQRTASCARQKSSGTGTCSAMWALFRCPTKPGTDLNAFCVPTPAQTGQLRLPAWACALASRCLATRLRWLPERILPELEPLPLSGVLPASGAARGCTATSEGFLAAAEAAGTAGTAGTAGCLSAAEKAGGTTSNSEAEWGYRARGPC